MQVPDEHQRNDSVGNTGDDIDRSRDGEDGGKLSRKSEMEFLNVVDERRSELRDDEDCRNSGDDHGLPADYKRRYAISDI